MQTHAETGPLVKITKTCNEVCLYQTTPEAETLVVDCSSVFNSGKSLKCDGGSNRPEKCRVG